MWKKSPDILIEFIEILKIEVLQVCRFSVPFSHFSLPVYGHFQFRVFGLIPFPNSQYYFHFVLKFLYQSIVMYAIQNYFMHQKYLLFSTTDEFTWKCGYFSPHIERSTNKELLSNQIAWTSILGFHQGDRIREIAKWSCIKYLLMVHESF